MAMKVIGPARRYQKAYNKHVQCSSGEGVAGSAAVWQRLHTLRVFIMKKTVPFSSSVVAAEGQVFSDLGNEVAILDLKSGTYYGLDAVGARIWGLIQEPRTVEEIHNTLISEYEVDPHRCKRDLIMLLQDLAEQELIEIRDGTST
jgi:hypothetical protein